MWRVSTVLDISGLSTPMKKYEEETRTRGTIVHAANEALAEGYTPSASEQYSGYIDALALWYRTFAPHVIAVERRVVNRVKRLTGQIDIIALILLHNVLWPYVIDVKTGTKAPWHGIQTAGYKDLAMADDELWMLMGEPFSKWDYLQRDDLRRAILYLPGDGKYQWAVQQDPGDSYRFNAALSLMQWRHDHGLLTYTDPEQPTDHHAVQVMPGSEGAF